MIGNIYIIKNRVNEKVYIGQTIHSLEKRFNEHIRKAFKIDFGHLDFEYNTKFYRDIRKFGEKAFYIELIEQCNYTELNNKERYYINLYDSYKNGYNSTLGGEGYTKYIFSEEEEKYIVDEYKKYRSTTSIANEFKVSNRIILRVLKNKNIEIRKETNTPKTIVMYDKYFNDIRLFSSKSDIIGWINECTLYSDNSHSVYGLISTACQNGNIAYGHRWQLASDLVYDDKIFRTKFDKEAYIQGKPAYQPEGKKYYIVDGSIDRFNNKQYKCIDCGKNITHRATRCLECSYTYRSKLIKSKENNVDKSNKITNAYKINRVYNANCRVCGKPITESSLTHMCNSCANVVAKGKSPKPSRDELKALLDQGLQKKQIAELYGRTPSTIQYWINSYELR